MRNRLIAIIILVVAGIAMWSWTRTPAPENRSEPVGTQPSADRPGGIGKTSPPLAATEPLPSADPQPGASLPAAPSPRLPGSPPMPAGDVVTAPPPSASEDFSPELISQDLDHISLSLRDYRTIMAQNPVGTNAEITKAIMGGNTRNAQLAPEGTRVNAKGEMVDRWGTPYFFHQITATSMEIHSAGPDKKMGTEDDVILR